ncbi:MAG: hypothetical protein KUF72_10660 [Candidatus Thiodiazotropha sp. (ex Ctena orbiculata)]|nr:hypothetical protein [Candidatus Thiodiazotropha taylori]
MEQAAITLSSAMLLLVSREKTPLGLSFLFYGAFGQVNFGGQTMLGSDRAIVGALAILVLGIIISVMIG